jgi:hypothetical protein
MNAFAFIYILRLLMVPVSILIKWTLVAMGFVLFQIYKWTMKLSIAIVQHATRHSPLGGLHVLPLSIFGIVLGPIFWMLGYGEAVLITIGVSLAWYVVAFLLFPKLSVWVDAKVLGPFFTAMRVPHAVRWATRTIQRVKAARA